VIMDSSTKKEVTEYTQSLLEKELKGKVLKILERKYKEAKSNVKETKCNTIL